MTFTTEEFGTIPTYAAGIDTPAFKSRRGNRPIYTLVLPIGMALDLLPKPDPNVPFPNNRPLVVKHAQQFGDYWEATPDGWGCPAGLISVREDFDPTLFKHKGSGNAVTIGVLEIPRYLADMSEILDIQHRIYGWHLKRTQLAERLRKAQDELSAARRVGEQLVVKRMEATVGQIKETLERFNTETITVEIAVMSEDEHRTLFATIADNALAISRSLLVDYDKTQAINRVAAAVAGSHPLLTGRVDWVRNKVTDSITKPNPHLLSGETLVNLVRPFATGSIVGRVTPARNADLANEETPLVMRVTEFLDVMAGAFDGYGAIMVDELRPWQLRTDSLLGSPTILRVLAAAYHELTTDRDTRGRKVTPRMTRNEALAFFKTLNGHMDLPITSKSPWMTTGVFPVPAAPEPGEAEKGVRAPSSRNQDLKTLTDKLVMWATSPDTNPFI